MSNVALSGNALGTGTFTIASPNSNTNRTLNLPDATGTVNISGAPNEVPAGSAAAPAVYPTGNTNTGVFFPAADTIAFAEGGVESARLDPSRNLLVGTTTNTNSSRIVSNGVIESTTGGVRFPDGTVQTTAATSVPTSITAIGSILPVANGSTSAVLPGATLAGSSLFYPTTVTQWAGQTSMLYTEGTSSSNPNTFFNMSNGTARRFTTSNSGFQLIGMTTLPGTWRVLSPANARNYYFDTTYGPQSYSETVIVFVQRIS